MRLLLTWNRLGRFCALDNRAGNPVGVKVTTKIRRLHSAIGVEEEHGIGDRVDSDFATIAVVPNIDPRVRISEHQTAARDFPQLIA